MVDPYVSALVIFGKDSAANLAWLQKRRCDLATMLANFMGGQLVSVAAPGQHVAFTRPMTVQDEFIAVNLALKEITGQPAIVSSVYPVMW